MYKCTCTAQSQCIQGLAAVLTQPPSLLRNIIGSNFTAGEPFKMKRRYQLACKFYSQPIPYPIVGNSPPTTQRSRSPQKSGNPGNLGHVSLHFPILPSGHRSLSTPGQRILQEALKMFELQNRGVRGGKTLRIQNQQRFNETFRKPNIMSRS